jgi:hypothetical protein
MTTREHTSTGQRRAAPTVIPVMDALLWALVAALVLAVLGVVLRKPRTAVAGWARGVIRRVQLRLYLEHRQRVDLAIARIAAELAQRRCAQDGNPDDQLFSDWLLWFSGDPDANVDYSRKQQRDMERMQRGEFRHRGVQ